MNFLETKPMGMIASFAVMLCLLAMDIFLTGSFMISWLFCPIWFCIAIIKSVTQRLGVKFVITQGAIPVLTMLLAWSIADLHLQMANRNADRIVTACNEFYLDNDRFPDKLQELTPDYIDTIPRAKYSSAFGEYRYWLREDGNATLVWTIFPPYDRKTYSLEAPNDSKKQERGDT